MRAILFSIALLVSATAFGDGNVVGPNCAFTWTPHLDTNIALVTSSALYISATPADPNAVRHEIPGQTLTTTCPAIGLTNPGQYYATVTQTNAAGEGDPSVEVPFVLIDLPPGAPSLTVDLPTSG